MSQNLTLDSVISFLLQPVPFLPNASFIAASKPGAKRRPGRALKPYIRPNKAPGKSTTKSSSSGSTTVAGILQRGNNARYCIGECDFNITSDTWIFGDVKIGAKATVQLVPGPGAFYARKIIVE